MQLIRVSVPLVIFVVATTVTLFNLITPHQDWKEPQGIDDPQLNGFPQIPKQEVVVSRVLSEEEKVVFGKNKAGNGKDSKENRDKEDKEDKDFISSDTMDDLELCLTLDHVLLTDPDTGSLVSVMPVSQELYISGIFVQPRHIVDPVDLPRNCTEEICLPMQNNSVTGSLYCELCVYDRSLSPPGKGSGHRSPPNDVQHRIESMKDKLGMCDSKVR